MYKPKMKQPTSSIPFSKHGDPDGVEYVVTCFSCRKKFRIHAGYSTYEFECPHCKELNELADD